MAQVTKWLWRQQFSDNQSYHIIFPPRNNKINIYYRTFGNVTAIRRLQPIGFPARSGMAQGRCVKPALGRNHVDHLSRSSPPAHHWKHDTQHQAFCQWHRSLWHGSPIGPGSVSRITLSVGVSGIELCQLYRFCHWYSFCQWSMGAVSISQSDWVMDHHSLLFVYSRMLSFPVKRSVVLIETVPRSDSVMHSVRVLSVGWLCHWS